VPTYDYKCSVCGHEESVIQTISQYVRYPKRPCCVHGGEIVVMDRKLSVNPAFSGVANALAGDRHYDGLRATDGSPIDSRTKHRQYMKDRGLTMASDFTETWKSAAKEREVIRSGASTTDRLKDVRETVERAIYS
jgi:putative FmdB family regulatory protein